MIKIGIYGASGYTGARLMYYLSRHKDAKILFATSRQDKSKNISELYGYLNNLVSLKFEDPSEVNDIDIDVLFSCAPDQTSMKIVPSFYEKGVKVIDLAGDYRMNSGESYEFWYGEPHESPEYLQKAVYGLTEINRNKIKNSKLIANPGCYPTSVILALYPLLKEKLISSGSIFVSSSSGISGAGRGASISKMFYEADSNIMPYKHGRGHKHVGEIEQELSKIAGEPCNIVFTPQVVPMKTGIVSTIFTKIKSDITREKIFDLYCSYYKEEFFVRVHKNGLPESKFVADTNFCDIGYTVEPKTGTLVIVSTICNLGKGASGQAVQNMNLIMGLDEKESLI